MVTTSPDNIWSPDAGDDYALTTDLAALADTVQDAITDLRGSTDTRVEKLAVAESAGIVTARAVPSQGSVTVAVTFPSGKFSVAPIVTLGILGAARDVTVSHDSVTTTGFNVYLGSLSTVSRTFGATWQAVQMTPTTAAG